MERIAYIGLGSNLGDRAGYIRKAAAMLGETPSITLRRLSSIIQTKPLGGVSQPDYFNAVVEIAVDLGVEKLHARLHEIEDALGRVRTGPNSDRTIDLDLLLFGNEVIKRDGLVVPHRDMHLRTFVLKGLAELAPDLIHPVIGCPVRELLSRLNGGDFTLDSNKPQLVSIAGIIGVGKTTLARGLAGIFDAPLLLEAYDTNPFLPQVYAGRKELALDCQLHFLSTRVEQLSRDMLAAGRPAVSDYVFDKEHIYAKRLLDPSQYELYSRINRLAAKNIVEPIVLIYLKASAAECLDRIHRRNRPYEQQIAPEFLEMLGTDYDRLVSEWKKSPIITIESNGFDCREQSCVAELCRQLREYMVKL